MTDVRTLGEKTVRRHYVESNARIADLEAQLMRMTDRCLALRVALGGAADDVSELAITADDHTAKDDE